MKIIKSEPKSGMEYDRCTRFTSGIATRTWCHDGVHLTADCNVSPGEPISHASHVRLVVSDEVWVINPSEKSPCNCSGEETPLWEAEVGKLPKGFAPNQILEEFGLARALQKSEILVVQRRVHSSDASHVWDVDIFKEGDVITENHLRDGHLLLPGDSVTLEESKSRPHGQGYYDARTIFCNEDGCLVRKDGMKEEKKLFARNQADILISRGFSDKDAWRIIKAAGPGAAVRAYEAVITLLKQQTQLNAIALRVVVREARDASGARGGEETFGHFSLKSPDYRNSGDFFSLMDGMNAVLVFFIRGEYSLE